jgi:hypothetical protein
MLLAQDERDNKKDLSKYLAGNTPTKTGTAPHSMSRGTGQNKGRNYSKSPVKAAADQSNLSGAMRA